MIINSLTFPACAAKKNTYNQQAVDSYITIQKYLVSYM